MHVPYMSTDIDAIARVERSKKNFEQPANKKAGQQEDRCVFSSSTTYIDSIGLQIITDYDSLKIKSHQ